MEDSYCVSIADEDSVGASSVQASRLCMLQNETKVTDEGTERRIACGLSKGHQVYSVQVDIPLTKDGDESPIINSMNGLPFPKTLNKETFTQAEIGPKLCGKVQSITFSKGMIAAVDEYGNGFCQRYFPKNIQESPSKKRQKLDNMYSVIEPVWEGKKLFGWEQGWTGISLSTDQNHERVATTHFFGRETLIMDLNAENKAISKITHCLNPTSCKFLAKGPFGDGARTIVVSEWNTVSIWDLRCSQKAVTNFKSFENCSNKLIYDVDASGDHSTLAFAGEGKDVSFADTRKWTIQKRWKCPVKYDIVGVELSSDGSHCFASGLDNELIVHNINEINKKQPKPKRDTAVPQSLPTGSLLHQNHRVFRSEAQWAGTTLWKDPSREDTADSFTVAGYSISGKLYLLRYKKK